MDTNLQGLFVLMLQLVYLVRFSFDTPTPKEKFARTTYPITHTFTEIK
ncbi:hypothetical protein HUW51_01980 [Adhaeribacter swui]|uniref:Uncharacterized protein n=1 Tax=Adhaeribacter swui TaxID=2086471 RepID=A0A7G7G319_9BACT|nr:hypothetical protein [Adhaeribacter swui]QNF31553.1 hypothetical protein HUW51_01980 [Adhaeribacter swui]